MIIILAFFCGISDILHSTSVNIELVFDSYNVCELNAIYLIYYSMAANIIQILNSSSTHAILASWMQYIWHIYSMVANILRLMQYWQAECNISDVLLNGSQYYTNIELVFDSCNIGKLKCDIFDILPVLNGSQYTNIELVFDSCNIGKLNVYLINYSMAANIIRILNSSLTHAILASRMWYIWYTTGTQWQPIYKYWTRLRLMQYWQAECNISDKLLNGSQYYTNIKLLFDSCNIGKLNAIYLIYFRYSMAANIQILNSSSTHAILASRMWYIWYTTQWQPILYKYWTCLRLMQHWQAECNICDILVNGRYTSSEIWYSARLCPGTCVVHVVR